MWTKENHDAGPLGTTETVVAYEQAMKEFATSATEFMNHIALLTKARDAYQRAIAVSTRLRDTLDTGDEILRTLMAKVEQAVQPREDVSDKKKSEAVKVEIKAAPEKADAARA